MHYYAWCLGDPTLEPAELCERALAPYSEDLEGYDDVDDRLVTWDWWQIGGRWTGRLDDAYDPNADPRNFDPRATFADGVKWPTQWVKFEGDVVDVIDVAWLDALRDDQVPYALFVADAEIRVVVKERFLKPDDENERWRFVTHDDVRAHARLIIDARLRVGLATRLVIVDYHC